MTEVHTGIVKWFGDKGVDFGFIVPDEAGPDMFVHVRQVEKSGLSTLQQGQRVSYQVCPSKAGGRPNATSLCVYSDAPAEGDIVKGLLSNFYWTDENPHGFAVVNALGPVPIYIPARQMQGMCSLQAVLIEAGVWLQFTLRKTLYKGNTRFGGREISRVPLLSTTG